MHYETHYLFWLLKFVASDKLFHFLIFKRINGTVLVLMQFGMGLMNDRVSKAKTTAALLRVSPRARLFLTLIDGCHRPDCTVTIIRAYKLGCTGKF